MKVTLSKLRVAALRALSVDPFDAGAMRRMLGSASDKLSDLRRATLRHYGIDPYSRRQLEEAIIRRGGQMPAPHVQKPKVRTPKQPGKPRAPRPAATTPAIPKLFSEFLASGSRNLQLAAKVLGITPRPPILRTTLRSAWIALIAQHHPDKGGNVYSAQAINTAYQLLKKFAS